MIHDIVMWWARYVNCNLVADQTMTKSNFLPKEFSLFFQINSYRYVSLCFHEWPALCLCIKRPYYKKQKIIRTISHHEPGQSYYKHQGHGAGPEILSLPRSVFPPMRSAFFPQETWSNYHQPQENWDSK